MVKFPLNFGVLIVLLLCTYGGCSHYVSNISSDAAKLTISKAQDIGKEDLEQKQSPPQLESTLINKVTKENGWQMPDLSEFNLEKRQQRTIHTPDSQKSINIYETKYTPKRDVTIRADRYFVVQPDRVHLKPEVWLINWVIELEKDKRPFGYRIFATLVKVDETGKVTSHLAAADYFAYYDENGDGNFTVFERGSLALAPRLPQWIIQQVDNQ